MHHYPHHIGDYAAATVHLSFIEDAAYSRLLRLYYRDERPLPADVAACQRLAGARTKDERSAVETVLREFFDLREDGWHQARADREIEAYETRTNTARKNGRLGGRPKTQPKPTGNPSGYSRDTQGEPSEKLTRTITQNQNHNQEEREEGAGAPAPLSPDLVAVDVWNEAAARAGWPKVQRLTTDRRKALKARLAECGGPDGFRSAVAKAEASAFLTGRTERSNGHENWQFNFDFMLRQAKFTKLMEGGFDDRPGSSNSVQSSHERQRQALAEWSREGDS